MIVLSGKAAKTSTGLFFHSAPEKPLYKALLKQILWSLHCSYLQGLDKENIPITFHYFSVIFGKWSEILDQDNFLLDHFMS